MALRWLNIGSSVLGSLSWSTLAITFQSQECCGLSSHKTSRRDRTSKFYWSELTLRNFISIGLRPNDSFASPHCYTCWLNGHSNVSPNSFLKNNLGLLLKTSTTSARWCFDTWVTDTIAPSPHFLLKIFTDGKIFEPDDIRLVQYPPFIVIY